MTWQGTVTHPSTLTEWNYYSYTVAIACQLPLKQKVTDDDQSKKLHQEVSRSEEKIHRSKQRNSPISLPVYLSLKKKKIAFQKGFFAYDGQEIGWAIFQEHCSVLSCVIYGTAVSKEEDASFSTTSQCFIKTYFILASTVTWLFISAHGRTL